MPVPKWGKEPWLRHNVMLAHRKRLQELLHLVGWLFLKQVVLDSNEVSCHYNPLQLLHPISAYPRFPPLLLPSSPSPGLVPTPSPSCPFAGLPIHWPPPLPAFVAAFVLTPTLWGPAALLPSCSISSSSSSFPCIGASLSRAAQPRRRRTRDGLLTLMSGTPKSPCPHPSVVARSITQERRPALCICTLRLSEGTMNNEKLRGDGMWPAQMRLSDHLAARLANKSLVSPCGRFCRSSQWDGFHPADNAAGTTPAPNRLLAPKCGGTGASRQNSSKILFYTGKTHILLQPHSQKSLNHFSWNFPKKVSLRLTPCKGHFSQNSLSLAKL